MKNRNHLLIALAAPLIFSSPALAQVKAKQSKPMTKAKQAQTKNTEETKVAPPETNQETKEDFNTVNRPGSVDIATEYDLSNLTIPKDQIHTLLPRDAIPALIDPELIPLADATYLNDDDRIIDVTVANGSTVESVAVPLKILNFHEVSNFTISGKPIAATYCPLCDSVTLVSRTVTNADGKTEILEFGVSGALYNSNVLMYDTAYKSLWSQLGLKAVSGPLAGTDLEHLPVKIVPWSQFKSDHPQGQVISINTGHERPYEGNPYQRYFDDQDYIMVPLATHGNALPKKTLGLGIKATTEESDESYFVAAASVGERFVIKTKLGNVIAVSTEAGVQVISAPNSVHTVQSFYYAFSAFHPNTKVLTESAE